MIRNFIKNKRELIERSKLYSQAIGLGKGEWIKVFIDFHISTICYKFTVNDYFVIGNGYTLSRYEKKRFFIRTRGCWLWNNVNDPKYVHLLKNKVDALKYFSDFVSRR